MIYIKSFENFKPIKINSHKPYKLKKNIDKSIRYLQKGIKSLRKRLDDPKNMNNSNINRSKMVKDKNDKIQKLKELSYRQLKQAEYTKNNITENNSKEKTLCNFLRSDNFDYKEIINYIGLDEHLKNYIEVTYDKNAVYLHTNSDTLSYILGTFSDNIDFCMNLYFNNIEYLDDYYDISEIDYIEDYISKKSQKKLIELGKILSFDFKVENDGSIKNGQIHEFYSKFNLYDIIKIILNKKFQVDLNESIKYIKNHIKDLPFNIIKSKKDDYCLKLKYSDMLLNLLICDLNNIKSVIEFVRNINHELNFTNITDITQRIKNINYKLVDDFIISNSDFCLENIDAIALNLLLGDNNIEFIKKNIKHIIFNKTYNVEIDDSEKELNAFDIASITNKKICKWFKTEEFKNIILKRNKDEIESYEKFILEQDSKKFNI